jgi:sugar phosphate permease
MVLTGTLAISLNGGATTYVFSALVPAMEASLGWSRSEVVGVVTVAALVKGGSSALIGPLFDRYGSRGFMTGAAILSALCFMLTSRMTDIWQFYLLVGVGVALAAPPLEDLGPRTAIANWFIRKRATAFAVLTPGRSVSGIVLVPLAAWLMAIDSWRLVYMAVGLAELLVLAPLCWATVRRRPEDMGLRPDGDPPRDAPTPDGQGGRIPMPSYDEEARWTRGQVLRTRSYWLITAGFFLIAFPASSIFIHMASYMQDKGLPTEAAAFGLTMYGLGALAGRPVWAYVVTHTDMRRTLAVFAFSYALAILGYNLAGEAVGLYIAVLFLGLIIGGSAQLAGQVWPDYYGRRVVGAITGMATFLNMPATASATLILAKVVEATHSYTGVFIAYAAVSFLAAAFFWTARRPEPPPQLPGA